MVKAKVKDRLKDPDEIVKLGELRFYCSKCKKRNKRKKGVERHIRRFH